jgi:DNA polymerase I
MVPVLAPVLVTDEQGLARVADFLKRVSVYTADSETNITDDFVERKIRTIQVGDRNEQYVIDLLAFAQTEDGLIASQGNYGQAAWFLLGPVLKVLKDSLENPDITKVGVGLQFDYEVFRFNLGIRMCGLYDCQRAEQNIHAGIVPFIFRGVNFWGMENMTERYLGLSISKDEQKGFDLRTPLTANQIIYCGLDARLPMGIRNGQLKILQANGLMDAVKIDCDAISPFGDMHLSGIGLDDEAWYELMQKNMGMLKRVVAAMDPHFIKVVGTKEITQEELARLAELESMWKEEKDRERRKMLRAAFVEKRKGINERRKKAAECEGEAAVNYGSNAQVLRALREMGFGIKKLPDTNDKNLIKCSKLPNLTVEKAFDPKNDGRLNYPAIDLFRLYRTISKLLDTYGLTWITDWTQKGHKHPLTRRIHSEINLFGAATGRTSSSEPNIQNIPKEKAYRHCFKARPGYRILTIDYSGAELRILAFMSQEPVWLEAFSKGWDVHSVGAEMLYGQKWKDATVHEAYVDTNGKTVKKCAYYYDDHKKCSCPEHKTQRDNIKAVNFGLAYGLSAKGLSDQLDISFADAEKLLADYKAAFPTVMKFLDNLGKRTKASLVARTVVGRTRRWIQPTWERAKEKLLKDPKLKGKTITNDMIHSRLKGMVGSIEREGKNMPIQGTNSDLTKRAMYLAWKELEPRFGAFFVNMVHDEIVVECPEAHAEDCFKFVKHCMEAAGAEWIKGIVMEVEGSNEPMWTK